MFQSKQKQPRRLLTLPVEHLRENPNQPRQAFDENELITLAKNIKRNGIIQPIVVRKVASFYEIIAGERRYKAAIMAGFNRIPCVLIEANDEHSAMLTVSENVERKQLNFFEQASSIARLITSHNLTQAQLAERLGLSQSSVANKLRLLRLSPSQRQKILENGLSERHARALLRLSDDTVRDGVLETIVKQSLNVAQSDELIDEMSSQMPLSDPRYTPAIRDVRLFINTITKAADTMRRSGVEVETKSEENERYIEYKILIAKNGGGKKFSYVEVEGQQLKFG